MAACLLPLVAVIVGGGIFFLTFPQSFEPSLSQVRETFASRPFLAAHPWISILVNTLINVLIGLVLGIFYFGEEFGWRAYLLPKLVEHFSGLEDSDQHHIVGARKAALLVGVIWGVWHWPGQFLSMKLDPSMPLLLPLVFLMSTSMLSVLLSWVTLRSGSVWPASVGHGVINQISGMAKSLMQGPAMPLLGPTSSGLIGGLGYIALAIVLLLSRRAFADGKAARSDMAQALAITSHS